MREGGKADRLKNRAALLPTPPPPKSTNAVFASSSVTHLPK